MPITVTITVTDVDEDVARTLINAATNAAGAAEVTETRTPAAKKSTAPKAEPAPEPEDIIGGPEATLEDAVSRATALVAAGKTAQVKAALATAGVKRVSELSGAKIATFLTALDG